MRKRIVLMIIIVIVSFTQFGCSKKQSGNTISKSSPAPTASAKAGSEAGADTEAASVNKQEIKLVKKEYKTRYLLTNGVEIQHYNKDIATSRGKISVYMIKVSGLKDSTVENKLNNAIVKDTETEINNYVKECGKLPVELEIIPDLNANNLLSISIRLPYSAPLYGFLYRLTDGERLYLKDIFTDGTDYVSLVNQKVIEGILNKSGDEEQYINEPFKTINFNQNFALTDEKLYIVFKPGESDFKERNSVSIPLSEIDDYVDIADRYSSTQRKTQTRSQFFSRGNNIFTDEKGSIIKRSNGDVWLHYRYISGLRDASFEKVINDTISNGINEVLNSKVLDGLVKDKENGNIASIDMQVTFNSYGILCIKRVVSPSDEYKEIQQFRKIYSFDLINKNVVDVKDIISGKIGSNKNLQDNFTNLIRSWAKNYCDFGDGYDSTTINSVIDYAYCMKHGQFYFRDGYLDGTYIVVHFDGNTIKGVSAPIECEVSLNGINSGAPEDFFGW